jgi:hypothetical protein
MNYNNQLSNMTLSTIFTFDSPAVQNAANTVYFNVSTVNGQNRNNAVGNGNYIKFKSDYERMQYLLGLFGTTNVQGRNR